MEKRTCVQCHKEFTLTDGEIEFYNSKNLTLPKRCKECRSNNKNAQSKPKNANNSTTNNSIDNNRSTNKSLKKIIVYILIALLVIVAVINGINVLVPDDNSTTTKVNGTLAITQQVQLKEYKFRNQKLFTQHFQKHGAEVGANSEEEYLKMANAVINNPNVLTKTEAEDNDMVYYVKDTREFVVVSTDGYIRTYYLADYDYFQRQ